MEKEIIIEPNFDVKTTFKATLLVLLSSRYMIYIICLLLLFTFNIFGSILIEEIDMFSVLQPIIILVLFISVYVFLTYRNTKKQILENPRIKENIVYTLNNEYFQEKGDSFEIKHFWKNIIKVVEKKEYFLIYVAKNKANFIRKSDLKNTQYDELKELLSSLNIKKSLK